jgi:hypothetical protein
MRTADLLQNVNRKEENLKNRLIEPQIKQIEGIQRLPD